MNVGDSALQQSNSSFQEVHSRSDASIIATAQGQQPTIKPTTSESGIWPLKHQHHTRTAKKSHAD